MPFITSLQLLLYVLTCVKSPRKVTKVVTWAEHDQTVEESGFAVCVQPCQNAIKWPECNYAMNRWCMLSHLDVICSRQVIWNETTSETAVSHACRCFSHCICTKVHVDVVVVNVVPIPQPALCYTYRQSSTLQCVNILGSETRKQQLHNITQKSCCTVLLWSRVNVKQCSLFWSVLYIGYTTHRGGSQQTMNTGDH